ncbi:MAG: type II toxin-antitoxin system VapC family toxin [Elainellaceae cyanobacterium]
MIVLDTHIWIWWVDNSPRLTQRQRQWIQEYQPQGLGVSIISCWEIAKLVENQKLSLSRPVDEWLNAALAYPGIQLLHLTIAIVVQSTQLKGFHRDPADQLIVATANVYEAPLLTADAKILNYPDANLLRE